MQNFAGEMHHHELRHLSISPALFWTEIKVWSSSYPLLLAQGFMEVHSITGDSRSILSYRHVARPTHRALQKLLIDFGQVISPQWAGELPSFCPSGKGEHGRHIVTTGQNLSVATSTFSLHLQLECSTKSLSTS